MIFGWTLVFHARLVRTDLVKLYPPQNGGVVSKHSGPIFGVLIPD